MKAPDGCQSLIFPFRSQLKWKSTTAPARCGTRHQLWAGQLSAQNSQHLSQVASENTAGTWGPRWDACFFPRSRSWQLPDFLEGKGGHVLLRWVGSANMTASHISSQMHDKWLAQLSRRHRQNRRYKKTRDRPCVVFSMECHTPGKKKKKWHIKVPAADQEIGNPWGKNKDWVFKIYLGSISSSDPMPPLWVQGTITSHLDYCNTLLMSLPVSILDCQ